MVRDEQQHQAALILPQFLRQLRYRFGRVGGGGDGSPYAWTRLHGLFGWGIGGRKASGSFLKKRTKKLFSFAAAALVLLGAETRC
jgi:hypothetical protein